MAINYDAVLACLLFSFIAPTAYAKLTACTAADLPQGPGILPKWLLLVSAMAIFNTVQNFTTTKLTHRLYNRLPIVAPVQARTFAVWTLMSAVVRFYTAYDIHNKTLYDMSLLSFLIVFGHFTSEIFVFRTAKLNGPVISPLIVGTTSLVWMITQYDFYVKA
ncbi:Erg28 like protein-domain-containing protein [Irpex rosettiformis]|uniref:Erg28 like protein-domain-containing protein n=1 Tax=Irpex rosettiformis TaxID=378272 RepID=A0ACB8TZC3_9APHY|nr:Erg28 like protein-domain-containing protein [Irpex rosettiformis]